MKYSQQHRKAFGEAFNFLNGHDILHLLVSLGAAEVKMGAALGRNIHPYRSLSAGSEAVGALAGLILAAGQVSVGMGLWAVTKMSYVLLARIRRPKYYPHERLRRESLARERRRVRERFTTSTCPKPAELLNQYAKARTGAREALRLGSMLCDLEAYCDNSLLRNADGEIVGRNPGVKGWIRENCPELLAHYKNAMRYKALAERFRQAVGAADPVPAIALVTDDGEAAMRLLGERQYRKITVRMRKTTGPHGKRTVSGTFALEGDVLKAAVGRAQEILAECEGNADNRLRSGIKKRKGQRQDVTEDFDRLRCGKKKTGTSNWRGGVARLAAILDERLGSMPLTILEPFRWKIVGKATDVGIGSSTVGERTSA